MTPSISIFSVGGKKGYYLHIGFVLCHINETGEGQKLQPVSQWPVLGAFGHGIQILVF